MMTVFVFVVVMYTAIFSPSLAFSSHFDSGGTPLSELSWPSSLAVVAVSFSGLFTFVFLMLACLCCKKGDISFKEFENTDGEEYQADRSTLASPASQNGPEVYILPLTEVSLPVAKQPGRSIQLLKSADVGRHSLLYLKEIGHGWFGKVLLGEVNAGLSTMQVVVKELTASASVQEQMQFLEEVQPYRALQHSALLQCLAQCTEITPYLLVMEFCPLGDLKGYLRSCRASDSVSPDPLILQQMACEIASGLLHLHKHNYIHSDLALRNCLLTSEMMVKIGDYGLSHSRYKDDYFVTTDQIWVPLRWIAPELVDEVHGNLLVVDQTKASNVWSLGVTIWELFELGNQPYRHYSDRQVLLFAVKEQQLKLPKPLLKVPLSERWYEVMQFCWLQPEQRPVAEELHLLLSYLCAKGASEVEEDFEKRWNSLRPSLGTSTSHSVPAAELASSAPSSSFPLLEHFSTADSFQSENGDDILTVMETSQGLNFEYKWEQARAEQPYCSSSASGPLGRGNPLYQDIYYPLNSAVKGCKEEGLNRGLSPSYYESGHPGVVPVLSAHSPSVSSEYYIRIEEPVECNISLEDTNLDYSPGLEVTNSSFSTGDRKSPTESQSNAYWSAAKGSKNSAYDSDASPDISLNMEPIHREGSSQNPVEPDQSRQYFSSDRDRFHSEQSLPEDLEKHWTKGNPLRSLRQHHTRDVPQNAPGLAPSLSSPSLGCCDPYLEANYGSTTEKSVPNEGYYDLMGPLQKPLLRSNYISVDVEAGDGLLLGRGSPDEDDLFGHSDTNNWTSNHSANNNRLNFDICTFPDSYLDVPHTTLSPQALGSPPAAMLTRESSTSHTSKPICHSQVTDNSFSCRNTSSSTDSIDCGTYIHLCHESRQERVSPDKFQTATTSQRIDPDSCAAETTVANSLIKQSTVNVSVEDTVPNPVSFPTVSKGDMFSDVVMMSQTHPKMSVSNTERHTEIVKEILFRKKTVKSPAETTTTIHVKGCYKGDLSENVSESPHTADSAMDPGCSSISLVDTDDCSDEDITDITSGIFADSPMDYTDVGNLEIEPRDSEEMSNLASSSSPCDAFSPDAYHTSILPKSLDSGYDTENNESPEFIPKDLDGKAILSASLESDGPEMVLQLDLDMDMDREVLPPITSGKLQPICQREKNQYRDSAYFSDYDTENDKSPSDGGSSFFNRSEDDDVLRYRADKQSPYRTTGTKGCSPVRDREEGYHFAVLRDSTNISIINDKPLHPGRSSSEPYPGSAAAPGLMMMSPFPPEMGGCLTKETTPDDGLTLESEHSVEEPTSESSSSTVSEGSTSTQEAMSTGDQASRGSDDSSPASSLGSDSTIMEFSGDIVKDTEDRENCLDGGESPELQRGGEDERRESEEDRDSIMEESAAHCVLRAEHDCSLESILPPLPEDLGVRAPLGDGEEADEEDSEESESDEELRSYNVQEQSEDSDEDFTAVPVVVSDRSGARHLRSLLKMPSLFTQSFCDELEHKKKAVSFFDDVTVFLFDQESPTGELADYSICAGAEPRSQASDGENHTEQDQVHASDESFDGNISEESGAFEWEDDILMTPSPSTVEPSSDDITTPPNSPVKSPEEKPVSQFARFSVSRFSITHVSDSDMDSVGGSIEDGDRE